MLLGGFLVASAVVSASVFGYAAVLLLRVGHRPRPAPGAAGEPPPIAVVVAVRHTSLSLLPAAPTAEPAFAQGG